jgi:hypothetical protein
MQVCRMAVDSPAYSSRNAQTASVQWRYRAGLQYDHLGTMLPNWSPSTYSRSRGLAHALKIKLQTLNPLKSNGYYMYQLISQQVGWHFVFMGYV